MHCELVRKKALTSTYSALVLTWVLWFSPFSTCKLFACCFGCPFRGDPDSYVCRRRPWQFLQDQNSTLSQSRKENIQHLSSLFLFPSCCQERTDPCVWPFSSFLQYHWNVLYIMMMASGMYKSVNTNFQAKCILFLGFWLVKSIFKYWFLNQIIFCNFCTFFKFKVCIFIFSSYGLVLKLYCSCACNVIPFADISILKMNSLCTHRL